MCPCGFAPPDDAHNRGCRRYNSHIPALCGNASVYTCHSNPLLRLSDLLFRLYLYGVADNPYHFPCHIQRHKPCHLLRAERVVCVNTEPHRDFQRTTTYPDLFINISYSTIPFSQWLKSIKIPYRKSNKQPFIIKRLRLITQNQDDC